MRKSSAPSLKAFSSVAKKRKFSTPFTNTSLTVTADQDAGKMPNVKTANKNVDHINKDKNFLDFSTNLLKNDKFGLVCNTNSKTIISGTKSSKSFKKLPFTTNTKTQSTSASDVSKDVIEKYFEVVW